MAGSVSVVLVRPVVAALPSAHHAAFWTATDLTPELVSDDEARISPAQFCVAWAELVRLTKPAIALAIADALPAGAFGIVEYVCRSAPTVRQALLQWVRYLNLLDDAVVVGLAVEGDRACLRVEVESEAPAGGAHELCFALVAQRVRQLSALPFRVTAVEFVHRCAGDPAIYRAWFDAPVRFGAPLNQIVFPSAALDANLISSDPQLLAILTRAADELQARAPADPSLQAQVARVLRDALRTEEGHVDHVAKRLGLTSRSLQRRLKEEGTSFNLVREQTRRDLTQRYLAEKLSISEISFLVGFSEPSAFFRAFKRWTGMTPIEARRAATT
ncbi:MAG: AraC family transcriptional regulator ligand-binding domain-containing protein [Deltaproteobacteria bacterium]|nr:AraC family transcriptional regulator ligand-binding domain-containing protein [Deltaproteobacteria bacterium]